MLTRRKLALEEQRRQKSMVTSHVNQPAGLPASKYGQLPVDHDLSWLKTRDSNYGRR